MNRILLATALALTISTSAFAKTLTGDEIKRIYPGTWKITSAKGAKGTITFKRDGTGGFDVGGFKSPMLWTVNGKKLCTVFISGKKLVDTCSAITKVGPNSYKAKSGSVISK